MHFFFALPGKIRWARSNLPTSNAPLLLTVLILLSGPDTVTDTIILPFCHAFLLEFEPVQGVQGEDVHEDVGVWDGDDEDDDDVPMCCSVGREERRKEGRKEGRGRWK